MHVSLTNRCRRVARVAASAAVVAAAACSDTDAPVAPHNLSPLAVDTTSRAFAIRISDADTRRLDVAVDDVIDRIMPTLGDLPSVSGLRVAFKAIGSALQAGSASSAGNGERVAAAVAAARHALGALEADTAASAELDVLGFTLDAVDAAIQSR